MEPNKLLGKNLMKFAETMDLDKTGCHSVLMFLFCSYLPLLEVLSVIPIDQLKDQAEIQNLPHLTDSCIEIILIMLCMAQEQKCFERINQAVNELYKKMDITNEEEEEEKMHTMEALVQTTQQKTKFIKMLLTNTFPDFVGAIFTVERCTLLVNDWFLFLNSLLPVLGSTL